MELDYKDRTFSFSRRKREKKRKKLFLILSVVLIIFAVYLFLSSSDQKKIEEVESLLLKNKTDRAQIVFSHIRNSFFHKSAKKELEGIIALFNNDNARGKSILENLDSGRSYLKFRAFLNFFSDNAYYEQLKIYSEFLLHFNKDTPLISEYSAIASTALFSPETSDKILRSLKIADSDSIPDTLIEIKKINKKLKSGKINFIFDSNKEPLAYYDVEKHKAISLINGFDFSDFNLALKKGLQFFSLTMDKDIQLKVHRLFRGKHGTFILMDLDDGSIVAAYSKPIGKYRNAVFSESFEPGSVIKCITMFAYINSGIKNIFPFNCRGNMVIDGRLFYDWIEHGILKDEIEALSRSCNLSFAKMGLLMGREVFTKYLKLFRFNTPPVKDIFLEFKTGRYKENKDSGYSLANLSIGLNDIEDTTFHLAFLSSLIASDGTVATPFMIMNRKNVLGTGNYYHRSSIIEVLKNNRAFGKVRKAMNRVVESEKGTGRRARTDIVRFAIKTGTAGEKKKGFDSVITGFFPYSTPKYAFALRLERAGKAELAGARFIKKFIESFYKN